MGLNVGKLQGKNNLERKFAKIITNIPRKTLRVILGLDNKIVGQNKMVGQNKCAETKTVSTIFPGNVPSGHSWVKSTSHISPLLSL